MRCLPVICLCAGMLSSLPILGQGQTSPDLRLARRIELHPIQTLTLTDGQFLRGDSSGTPTLITGELRLAARSGRLPLVILMHGSGGAGAVQDAWSREFLELGISTLIIDGMTGRGLISVADDQALLGRLNFILDIYRALGIVASHPRVDPSRIALMGFSRGGQASLYASLMRFHDLWNRSGATFAAYVSLYPDCGTTYQDDQEVVDRPIRIHHGVPDDFNPVIPCEAYVERLRAAGHDAAITTYPNAHHSFDNPYGSLALSFGVDSQTVRKCRIAEDPVGRLINSVTQQPFTYADPCVERGTHANYDPAATDAVRAAVKKLLLEVFQSR